MGERKRGRVRDGEEKREGEREKWRGEKVREREGEGRRRNDDGVAFEYTVGRDNQ